MALLIVLSLAFVAIIVRLGHLQAVSPDRYAAIGEAQRFRTLALPADRGSVFDRNGNELAMSIPQHTVWADPRQVTNPRREAEQLAPVLGIDAAELREKLTRPGAFVYLARKVDDDIGRRIEKLELPGIHLLDEPERFLPNGDLAASVLGRVGLDNNGLSGLELKYEDLLRGRPGEMLVERGVDGRTIAAGHHELRAAARGFDAVLTIDRSLQYETERALSDQIVATGAQAGIAVVMRPGTGEVLAMANLVAGGDEESDEVTVGPAENNMALTNVYEPGSVNKVITVAAAIEEGLVEPATPFVVPDHYPVSDHVFSDHDDHPTESMSVADILTNSSNVGTIMIAQKLGKERIDSYLRRFGFGSETGIDFPGESGGLLLDPDEWSGTAMGSVPIGQSLAVTAVQMLAAYNTIANKGVYVAPRLVQATVDADGERTRIPPSERRRVVSTGTAEQVAAMLTQVVEKGTGTAAAIDRYTVAGKTGTARKPAEGRRGYEVGAYVASFAGFVPAEDPELSMVVFLDEPRSSIYGGVVSAPLFAQVSQYALRLYRIPPVTDRELAPEAVAAVENSGQDTAEARQARQAPTSTLRTTPTTSP